MRTDDVEQAMEDSWCKGALLYVVSKLLECVPENNKLSRKFLQIVPEKIKLTKKVLGCVPKKIK